ncbi:MAG: hypothetical protein DWQ02_01555 [Bacteroidetes bacterium]|nr:MAG: hypothetical protein DWQ02_01555 [Bacteroidota bacterium]
MLFRFVFILACVVIFINSCNSVVSLNFGTHKLRSFTMEEVESSGLGDSDFVEITDAQLTGDFIHAPGTKEKDGGLVLYPLLSKKGLEAYEKGESPSARIVAWTDIFEWDCLEAKNCAPKGETTIKGVIRKMEPEKDKSQSLNVQLPELPIYLEVGREPTPWYWHALLMLIAGGSILFLEIRRLKKKAG